MMRKLNQPMGAMAQKHTVASPVLTVKLMARMPNQSVNSAARWNTTKKCRR